MHPWETPTLREYRLHLFFFIGAWPKTPASGGELDAEQCLEALLLGVDVFFAGKSWPDGKHILCTYAANPTYRDYRLTTGSIAGHELNRCSMVSRAPSKTSPGTIL